MSSTDTINSILSINIEKFLHSAKPLSQRNNSKSDQMKPN